MTGQAKATPSLCPARRKSFLTESFVVSPEPFPKILAKPSFDKRFDLRSFGEPLAKLRAVPIQDHGEPLVDLREFCPDVILYPGCLPFLRETVAHMVNDVQASAAGRAHAHGRDGPADTGDAAGHPRAVHGEHD